MQKAKNRFKNTPQPLQGLFDTETFLKRSITYLKENEPEEGYFVGFSGGKDSIVALEVCKLANVKYKAYYSCTRIDPPEIVKFIKENYPEVIFLFPKITFWEGIKKKAPPLRMARWCCDVLKKEPSSHIHLKHRIMGIRAEESRSRANRPQTDYFKKYRQWIYKPIFYWKEWHVWEFIRIYNLKYPSLYDEGFFRIGCVLCPFVFNGSIGAQKRVIASQQRWPGLWKVFKKSCEQWWDTKYEEKGEIWLNNYETFEEYYEAYLKGFDK